VAATGSVAAQQIRTGLPGNAVAQRLVYAAGSAKAAVVPVKAKTVAKWMKNKPLPLGAGHNPRLLDPKKATILYDPYKNKTYRGSQVYNNNPMPDGSRLPTALAYTEWDVDEYFGPGLTDATKQVKGYAPNAERMVAGAAKGADSQFFYTADHYANFTEFDPDK
jgi:hypothetical protein